MGSEKSDKIAGFLMGGCELHYSYDDIWKLLLQSTSGQKILQEDYRYVYHVQGRWTAREADQEIGDRFEKHSADTMSVEQSNLLAELIETAHDRFAIPYEKIFQKTSLSDFLERCGLVLGNYDDKLIKSYLM